MSNVRQRPVTVNGKLYEKEEIFCERNKRLELWQYASQHGIDRKALIQFCKEKTLLDQYGRPTDWALHKELFVLYAVMGTPWGALAPVYLMTDKCQKVLGVLINGK